MGDVMTTYAKLITDLRPDQAKFLLSRIDVKTGRMLDSPAKGIDHYDYSQPQVSAIWHKLHCRCYQTWDHNYRGYGAKGIGMGERWRHPDFGGTASSREEAVLRMSRDIGPAPKIMYGPGAGVETAILGRIDHKGDYELDNVQWEVIWIGRYSPQEYARMLQLYVKSGHYMIPPYSANRWYIGMAGIRRVFDSVECKYISSNDRCNVIIPILLGMNKGKEFMSVEVTERYKQGRYRVNNPEIFEAAYHEAKQQAKRTHPEIMNAPDTAAT